MKLSFTAIITFAITFAGGVGAYLATLPQPVSFTPNVIALAGLAGLTAAGLLHLPSPTTTTTVPQNNLVSGAPLPVLIPQLGTMELPADPKAPPVS